MKRIIVLLLSLLIAISFSGCAADKNGAQKDTTPDDTQNATTDNQQNIVEFAPAIAGISRGDSKDKVIETLGDDYEEQVSEEAGYFGEPYTRMTYQNVSVIVGNNSNKVLEIETSSPDAETSLGFKVGDDAQDVLDEYEAKYETPKSRQDNTRLTGWFLIKDNDLVIFNFDNDGTLINEKVEPGAKVERIKITSFDYMD